MSLFEHILVPVASRSDVETTCNALIPYLDKAGGTAVIVYVIEKAGGAPDKASVEQLREEADRLFDIAIEKLVNADIKFETRLLYGRDVAETIISAAADEDVSAIVFTLRGSNRVVKLFTAMSATRSCERRTAPLSSFPIQKKPMTDQEFVRARGLHAGVCDRSRRDGREVVTLMPFYVFVMFVSTGPLSTDALEEPSTLIAGTFA